MLKTFRRNVAIILIFVFCFSQLSGCSLFGSKFSRQDGAPNVNFDASKIPDAVPQIEPRSKYGNSDYVVEGHRYHVLKSARGYNKVGYASWYGTKFHGQYTSTHERYNLFSMTAASPELPLPTYAQVTNLDNGKKVIVKVNDRGPFRCNRVLDLSYAAAKKLGYAGRGTARVRVVAIDPRTWGKTGSQPTCVATQKNMPGYYLQVGAYSRLSSAQNVNSKISELTDKSVRIVHSANLYKVQIGPLANNTQIEATKHDLVNHGYNHLILVKVN